MESISQLYFDIRELNVREPPFFSLLQFELREMHNVFMHKVKLMQKQIGWIQAMQSTFFRPIKIYVIPLILSTAYLLIWFDLAD